MKEHDTKGTKMRQFQQVNDRAVGIRGKHNRETRVWVIKSLRGKKRKKLRRWPKLPQLFSIQADMNILHEEGSPWPPAWKEAQESAQQCIFFTLGIVGLSICLNKNYRVEKDAVIKTDFTSTWINKRALSEQESINEFH